MAVEVETEPTFKNGKPQTLFRGFQNDPYTIWDIHPNGTKFLMMKPLETTKAESTQEESTPAPQPKIIVVVNWFDELKERVPVD